MLVWAREKVKHRSYYSRVDIELINEQVKLFYSNLDEVEIQYTDDCFKLTEYVRLEWNGTFNYYPLEEVSILLKKMEVTASTPACFSSNPAIGETKFVSSF